VSDGVDDGDSPEVCEEHGARYMYRDHYTSRWDCAMCEAEARADAAYDEMKDRRVQEGKK